MFFVFKNLNLKIQIGRLDTRKSHRVIRQEVCIACPYWRIGALFWLLRGQGKELHDKGD